MDKSEISIGVWISILHRYRRNYIIKRLEKHGALGSSFLLVLTVYHNYGVSQEKVSELLKTDKASIARAVKKLQQEGYLTREPDTVDKRAYKLYLSAKAQALVPEIQSAVRQWEQAVLCGVPAEAYQVMARYLEHMAENACQISCDHAPQETC